MTGDTPRSRKTRSTTTSAGQKAKTSKSAAASSQKAPVRTKAASSASKTGEPRKPRPPQRAKLKLPPVLLVSESAGRKLLPPKRPPLNL